MTTKIQITYFDTAMTLIEIGPLRLLTDPVFDPAGAHFEHGPIHLDKTNPSPITPAALGPIDAVLLSHEQHGDNLDRAGRAFLSTVPKVLTTPQSAAQINAIGLHPWQQTTLGDLTITAAPAQHGPDGTQAATGDVTGFLLTWPGLTSGPVYISGDTVRFPGTAEIEAKGPISLALLHIGRVQVAAMGDLEFTLSAEAAVAYAQALQARHIVPLHYDGWRHFSQTQSEAQQIFAASPIADRVRWLAPGQSATFEL